MKEKIQTENTAQRRAQQKNPLQYALLEPRFPSGSALLLLPVPVAPPSRPLLLSGVRAAEDEEAENRGSFLGDFGVWLGLVDLNQGENGPICKEIGP